MTHTEILIKAAALIEDAPEPQPQPKHWLLTDALLMRGGAAGVGKFNPLARGKWHGYHGSSPENMKNMKRNGIWTMGEAHDRNKSLTKGLLDKADPEGGVFRKSKNMAFVGKKGLAKMFIAQALMGPGAEIDLKTTLKSILKAQLHNPLAVEIPYDQLKRRVKINPEFAFLKKRLDEAGQGHLAKFNPMKNTRGIKGGVKPSEIRWGKGWRPFSWAGIKASPLRAMGGLLGTAASLGVSGYGLLDANKHLELIKARTWGKNPQ